MATRGGYAHCRLAVFALLCVVVLWRNERCVLSFSSASWALVLNSGNSQKVPERNLDLLKESTAQGDRIKRFVGYRAKTAVNIDPLQKPLQDS